MTVHSFACARRTALCIALSLLLAAEQFDAQRRGDLATFSVLVGDYIAPLYDQSPAVPASFVYYRGETAEVFARVANFSETRELSFTLPSSGSLNFEWTETPSRSRAVPRVAQFGTIGPSGSPVPLGGEIRLPPHSEFLIRFDFGTANLPNGVYHVRVQPVGWQSSRELVLNSNTFVFEVRQPMAVPERLELLHRKARRALNANDAVDAESHIRDMLQIHANSALAYSLQGEAARKLGRVADATASERRAKEILEQGADLLYPPQVRGRR